MSWHYLPVYSGKGLDKAFSLCEVYLDKNQRLKSWTAKSAIAPIGNDVGDLAGALNLMAKDVKRWKPVKFDTLKVGMKFREIA